MSLDEAFFNQGAIGGLHLLPIYPSSGDGGFAPLTYKEVDPALGTWADVVRLSKEYDLLLECMVRACRCSPYVGGCYRPAGYAQSKQQPLCR